MVGVVDVGRSLIRASVDINGRCDGLRLAHILKGDLLMREELLEDIRDLELSARGCPLASVLTIFVLGNINGVVDEAHTIVGRFVLENITVHLAVVHDELDDLRRSVGDLDRVRFDVSNNKAPFLNLVLEVDHKQGSTLGDNIIFVAGCHGTGSRSWPKSVRKRS